MSEWTAVKDDLPPAYDYVWVCAVHDTDEPTLMSVARQCKGEWQMLNLSPDNAFHSGDIAWFMEPDEITHWMKIPQEPKKS